MFNWLKRKVFGIQRSSKNGERLTDDEKQIIEKGLRRGKGAVVPCPDCGYPLYQGPEGGASVNVCCHECGSEFNLTCWGTDVAFCERISDAGPRCLGNREKLYNLDPIVL